MWSLALHSSGLKMQPTHHLTPSSHPTKPIANLDYRNYYAGNIMSSISQSCWIRAAIFISTTWEVLWHKSSGPQRRWCCCCWVASVVSDSVWPRRRQPTRLLRPWDSPGKNTGVGCHVLLQCMKVESESEVAQSCLTLLDPMDCSPPGSSVHGSFQARELEWVPSPSPRRWWVNNKSNSPFEKVFNPKKKVN